MPEHGGGLRLRAALTIMRALLLVFALTAESVSAGPVLTFATAGALSGNQNDQTIGWSFDVLSPITVSGLGWYDPSGAGLAFAHTVGIWDPGGNLLVSGTVDAGTADPLDGLFRTIAIAPLTLTPGSGYVVGGQNFFANTDQLAFGVVPATIAGIGFAGGVYSDIDGIFELPTFLTADGGDANCCWGPSFSTTEALPPSAAPEPETIVVVALAMPAILAWRYRRNSCPISRTATRAAWRPAAP